MRDFHLTITNKLSKDPPKRCFITEAALHRLAQGNFETAAVPIYLIQWALLPHDLGDTLCADHTDSTLTPPLSFEYLMITM